MPCYAMAIVVDNGKMNPPGRLAYGAVIRHHKPLLCTISHTAFYPFYRWKMTGEACSRRRELWYDLHILKGLDARKCMSYETQLDRINRMFTGAGVTSPKKTRANWLQGAKLAEPNRINKGQIEL